MVDGAAGLPVAELRMGHGECLIAVRAFPGGQCHSHNPCCILDGGHGHGEMRRPVPLGRKTLWEEDWASDSCGRGGRLGEGAMTRMMAQLDAWGDHRGLPPMWYGFCASFEAGWYTRFASLLSGRVRGISG